MNLMLRRRAMMGKNGQSPTDYITNGLVFHLDGADFNGTTWVDKVGNIEYTKSGSIISDNGGVKFGGDNNSYLYADQNVTAPYNSSTIEIVYKSDVTYWGVIYYPKNIDYMAYIITNGRTSYNLGANKTTKATGNILNIYTHSISNTHNYFNGENKGTSSTASWNFSPGPSKESTIGVRTRIGYTNDYPAKGTLYQIRIYNRILTEAEILHNANIDAQKYNITL